MYVVDQVSDFTHERDVDPWVGSEGRSRRGSKLIFPPYWFTASEIFDDCAG